MTSAQIAAWGELQSNHGDLWSPFFRPEFTLAVAAVRPDVEVAVLYQDDIPAGFFPYQRGDGNVATPVGGWLSDYQAVIAAADLQWDPLELLRACGLQAWNFTDLVASQSPWAKFHRRQSNSSIWHVAGGLPAHGAQENRASKDWFAQHQRKARKASREIGPLRFVPCETEAALPTLMSWKRRQYRETGVLDRLRPAWVSDLLARVMKSQSAEFSGPLSALYFGDRIAALHLGLRSRAVLHYWLPAYDMELSRYSPGTLLLLEAARVAEESGLRTIDFGPGDEPYKARLTTETVAVASGFVDRRPVRRALKAAAWRTRNCVSRSALRGPVRALVHRLTPLYDRMVQGAPESTV
ncbi:MAG: GNAT family N-acetyltransferase [Pirellulales bacterium]